MRAGKRTRKVAVQRRAETTDAAGQPIGTWAHVCYLFVNIGHDTGKAAIRRSSDQVSVPYSQYSFAAALSDVRAFAVTDGDRIVHDSLNFDIKGITQNLQDRTEAFLVCELGGNEG